MIRIGNELFIDKERIAVPLRLALEWKGNQISKTAFWQSVLRREQPVIRLKAQLMTARHCLCEQSAPQPAGLGGGNGF